MTYLICGIAVPNDEFAILRGTDQEPRRMRTAILTPPQQQQSSHEIYFYLESQAKN